MTQNLTYKEIEIDEDIDVFENVDNTFVDSKDLDGDTDTLRQYLKDIGNYNVLPAEEVSALISKIRKGDQVAYSKLIEHNLKLVVKYAKSIKRAYRVDEPIMDMVQAGNIGLMRAVDKFEPDKGFAFSTYATWWIKQAIVRYVYDNESAIRIPVHMSEKFALISRTIAAFKEDNGREPDYEELKEIISISPKDYKLFKSVDRSMVSLNATIGEDGEHEVMDFIADGSSLDPVYEQTQAECLSETVNDVLAKLDERERHIISARYGLDGTYAKTLEEIGLEMGITRERVRQIENIAMNKLRHSVKASSLRAFR